MIWYKDWVFYLIVGAVFIFDQISKEFIRLWMPLGDSWPSTGFLRIVHGTNTGSAFGLFAGFTNLLILASILGIAAVLYYFYRQGNNAIALRISLGLIVGGALGNLFDRVVFGKVVDFISVGWWPSFNIADSAISVGMFLLIFTMIFGERLGWTEQTQKM
ncbi:MAG: signal peptidase II [Chloroflexota bacterium]|jgi:signal peptidase II|nr:signal peptidase II [Chloroflexota bacterium]MQF66272.1 signal peptidase II [SAR202 cluster bacterium AC-647-P02_OGT_505m]|tara:strand:- start:1622 stop:2101 length:480 start_codon:yes stop_codon:yes gene_type:complete